MNGTLLSHDRVTSEEGMMVVSASDTDSGLCVTGSRGVKVLGMPVVVPSSSGPEERLVSDLVNHSKR